MEAAICTRCQSSNPIFTKFCLTCGLEITAEMKRVITASGNNAPTNIPLAKAPVQPEPAAAGTPQQATKTQQPQAKESTGWLKGLRFLGRS